MSGPRNYSAGTERALFRLARGTCYAPGCDVPILRSVNGHPVVNVEISHIRGAQVGSARFDRQMTDPDRSSFANLILLCTAHHKLIDRIAPDDHPVELLEAWKRESEAGEGLEDLSEMDGTLTDQRLADLIERAVSRIGATREVRVELEAGILHGGGQALTSTFEAVRELLRINEHIRDSRRLVVTTIRNVGFADATVESVTLNYSFRLKGSADLPESTLGLLGRNDFLLLNPELPHRLPSGDSMHWLTDLASLSWVEERGQDGDFTAVRASIQLGSGERVESNSVPWGELPF